MWLSNLLDLIPMDFSIWSILEEKMPSRCNPIDVLKRALIQAWDEITVEQVAGIVDTFLKCLKTCKQAPVYYEGYTRHKPDADETRAFSASWLLEAVARHSH